MMVWGGTKEGMGQYMIGGQQMFPNKKKQNADAAYMQAMSSVEKEKKNASLNELINDAKQSYRYSHQFWTKSFCSTLYYKLSYYRRVEAFP